MKVELSAKEIIYLDKIVRRIAESGGKGTDQSGCFAGAICDKLMVALITKKGE